MTAVLAARTQPAAVRTISIVQGEQYVGSDPDLAISTILGSCVAACIRDSQAGVGGMNHFLLPEAAGESAANARCYGAYAMELLVNQLFQAGARRNRLEAKLFGGARVVQGLSDVGARNAEFARHFLADEGILLVSSSLGGTSGRRLQYWPVSGRARQSFSGSTVAVDTPSKPMPIGSLELF